MSIDPLLSIMDKLEKMHKSLLKLSYHKTELIKVGDMDGLDQMLKDEQAHIAAISQLEQQRQKMVTDYLGAKGIAPSGLATVADVMEAADELQEKEKLEEVRKRLMLVIDRLKNQNDLNQKMIFQSLQFVNMTLDLLRPQPDQINYSKTQSRGNRMQQTHFDSQA
ncbi:flagellar protein FlgN [Rummeliibacillus pycnus]|uniref:flagellar protein FlgN n=1 Tax=Rummeliibacillus pycnus TaxID=101070 RepID=UPI000C9BCF68|nr:flagellar protein FlgN [Rummeliibacillus pycnus]